VPLLWLFLRLLEGRVLGELPLLFGKAQRVAVAHVFPQDVGDSRLCPAVVSLDEAHCREQPQKPVA